MRVILETRNGDTSQRAGIVITNSHLLLCGQPTNMIKNNWKLDIFKGHIQKDESPLNAAIRECWEESGIRFDPWKLTNPIQTTCDGKPLFLFLAKIDEIIPTTLLSCASTFIDDFDGLRKPEVEAYVWINPKLHLNLIQERLRPGIRYYFSKILAENNDPEIKKKRKRI
jgi:8-oxo-dGTP pyrophosphatase MutT (NUDIX family)